MIFSKQYCILDTIISAHEQIIFIFKNLFQKGVSQKLFNSQPLGGCLFKAVYDEVFGGFREFYIFRKCQLTFDDFI